MEQGTVNWLDFRKNGIGSSDIPAILNKSPYKTRYQLFLEKTGKKQPKRGNDFILNAGHAIEDAMRPLYELKINAEFKPLVTNHFQNEWAIASLDGYNKTYRRVWECKMVGKDAMAEVMATGKPLEHHYIQIQWQLMVTGADSCDYTCVLTDKKYKIKSDYTLNVLPDVDFIMNIFQEASKFWEWVKKGEYGGEELIRRKKLISVIDQYIKERNEFEKMSKRMEKMEKIIKQFSLDGSIYENIMIVEQKRIGAIDYAKIPELQGIDLEKYRKRPIKFKLIRMQE